VSVRAPGCRGQATVEVVAMVPLVVAGAVGVAQVLAAGAAAALADHAAEAGAVALVQGRDPRAAVRAAVPAWSRPGLEVEVSGSRVRVRLRPPALVPGAGAALAAVSEARAR
jgi:hypothetical protein